MNRSEFLASTSAAMATGALGGVAQIPGGRTFVVPFASAPYPHPSRAAGYTYQGHHYDAATHYADASVGIFIPDGWRPEHGAIDLVVHFYGWNHTVASAFAIYRLREQLARSGRNAILVVPEGPTNAPDSGDGKLELDPNGFARFVGDLCAWLRHGGLAPTERPGRIVLSAHSGGYGGAGGVLTRGGMNESITDVLLFDASYGYYDAFAGWARARGKRLASIFTRDTIAGNVVLMGMIQGPRPTSNVWLASDLTRERLAVRDATFAFSGDVAHDDLLTHASWYALLLEGTALDARPSSTGS